MYWYNLVMKDLCINIRMVRDALFLKTAAATILKILTEQQIFYYELKEHNNNVNNNPEL